MAATEVSIEIKAGDALAERADVLILKHAQHLYGIDKAVVARLTAAGRGIQLPQPWQSLFVQSIFEIAASRLLFVGVPQLAEFGYKEIRRFARQAIAFLAGNARLRQKRSS